MTYDSHLIMQELANFNLKINVISNALEKYMDFTFNNKSQSKNPVSKLFSR